VLKAGERASERARKRWNLQQEVGVGGIERGRMDVLE
jgi:hypothetical protein